MISRDRDISRRSVIRILGAGSVVSIAGCQGLSGDDSDDGSSGDGSSGDGSSGDGSSGDLGERVPEIQMEYWSDLGGFSTTQEQMAPIMRQNFEEHLGVDVRVVPKDISTQTGDLANDANRDVDHSFGWWAPSLDRLDPTELFLRHSASYAGGNGLPNNHNWANCEYSSKLEEANTAETDEERRELFTETISIASEEYVFGDICPVVNIGAWRSDTVEMNEGDIGQAGVSLTNAQWVYSLEPKEDLRAITIGVTPQAAQTLNFPTNTETTANAMWNQVIHSPIWRYNADYEATPILGEVEIAAADRVVVELFDDATFTNGDPVTPEDVKFTFEQTNRGGESGAYPSALVEPYDEITVVDDSTVEFTFTEPNLSFARTTLMRWGIFHKESFEQAGAVEDPAGANFQPPLVTSGPYEVADITTGENIIVEAAEDHVTFDPSTDIIFQAYQSQQAAINALGAGEAEVIQGVAPPNLQSLQETQNISASSQGVHTVFLLSPQVQISPGKFKEWREASFAAIDREQMISVALADTVEPELYGSLISQNHPFYPDEEVLTQMTDDPAGDPERARQVLLDNGWGFDDDGNLHYPPDADLSPLWPQGETPSPEEFPCLSE